MSNRPTSTASIESDAVATASLATQSLPCSLPSFVDGRVAFSRCVALSTIDLAVWCCLDRSSSFPGPCWSLERRRMGQLHPLTLGFKIRATVQKMPSTITASLARFLSASPSIARFREQWQQQQRSQFFLGSRYRRYSCLFLSGRSSDRPTAAPTEIMWRVALIDAPSKCHSHNLRFAPLLWMELAPMLLRSFPCSQSCERARERAHATPFNANQQKC